MRFHPPVLSPRLLLPLMLGALLLAGCTRYFSDQDSQADFSHYHRFAWVNPPAGPVRNPIMNSEILGSRVQRAVEATLKARGYEEVTPDANPDFLVTYHTSSEQQLQSNGALVAGGGPCWHGCVGAAVALPDTQTTDVGTLMLDVSDAQSKRLVWRGWTTRNITSSAYDDSAAADAVQNILAKFPGH